MKTIGEKIQRLREEANLSQSQISKYLGVDQSLISKIEKNQRQVSVVMLEKLAVLFGIQLEDFDKEDISIMPINYFMRTNELDNDDLNTIAKINTIAYNSEMMANLLEKKNEN